MFDVLNKHILILNRVRNWEYIFIGFVVRQNETQSTVKVEHISYLLHRTLDSV